MLVPITMITDKHTYNIMKLMNVNGEEFTLSDFKLQYISKSTIATNL